MTESARTNYTTDAHKSPAGEKNSTGFTDYAREWLAKEYSISNIKEFGTETKHQYINKEFGAIAARAGIDSYELYTADSDTQTFFYAGKNRYIISNDMMKLLTSDELIVGLTHCLATECIQKEKSAKSLVGIPSKPTCIMTGTVVGFTAAGLLMRKEPPADEQPQQSRRTFLKNVSIVLGGATVGNLAGRAVGNYAEKQTNEITPAEQKKIDELAGEFYGNSILFKMLSKTAGRKIFEYGVRNDLPQQQPSR